MSQLRTATMACKGASAFFAFQCQVGHSKIAEGTGIVAIVLDAKLEFGFPVAVQVHEDGRQLAVLRVASDDGGFVVPSSTPSDGGDKLQPDDLVLWVPSVYSAKVAGAMLDKRSGWIGLIRAKIKPEFDSINRPFDILCRYD